MMSARESGEAGGWWCISAANVANCERVKSEKVEVGKSTFGCTEVGSSVPRTLDGKTNGSLSKDECNDDS